MKTAIVAVLMIASLASPWVKEPVEIPTPESEVTVTASTDAVESTEPEDNVPDWNVIDNCTITHYCHGACCNGQKYAYKPLASGAWPEAGRSVAVDRSVIPLGSEVMIDGHIYVAEDTGVIGNHVDIFCDSHQEALNRGMFKAEVCWR